MRAKKVIFKAIALTLLLAVPVLAYSANPKKAQTKKTFRILYWNIQNGMWAGQEDNYQKFVDWINSKQPDICIFCEAASIYYTGTDDHMPNEERYLPAHWDELCARWGHSYHQVSPRRTSKSTPYGLSNYPQVVTSRYPIDSIGVFIGGGILNNPIEWVQIHPEGSEKPLNIVTYHAKNGKYGRNVPREERAASSERYEGETVRIEELTYVLENTILTHPDHENEFWLMAGDYNSYSPVDNFKYKWNKASLGFQTQTFMLMKSPYHDLVAESFPDLFFPSVASGHRIDYMYVTKPMIDACSNVLVELDSYTRNERSDVNKFYIPSDHYPIIADFKVSKLK